MDEITIPLAISSDCVPLKLNWIPHGKFVMGVNAINGDDVYEEDKPEGEFEVVLSKGYWLGIHPVTQCQWKSIMGSIPSRFKGANLPVDEVSWSDAINFCDRLNAMNLPLPENYFFTLPTEAQWEYGCYGGTTNKYQLGNSVEDLSLIAWHRDNTPERSLQTVGQKMPNNWGLYDMLGNVREWCLAQLTQYPTGIKQVDWIGEADDEFSGVIRAARGGNFLTPPQSDSLTCSGRFFAITDPIIGIGFRLCLRYRDSR